MNVVLILGAGASKPYGLPLGRELRDLVLSIRHTDSTIKLLSPFRVSRDELHAFQNDLRMSAAGTVDSFLEKRPNWMKIGKLATALALDGRENEDKLFPPCQPRDHWYEAFWQALRCSSWSALKKRRVHVITFNYDRTLECYLCGVISNNLRVSRETAAGWLNEEFVIRPHGTLRDYEGERLHWITNRLTAYERMKQALESIVVISEAKLSTKAFKLARWVLREADSAAFFGFGYHEQNMRRLGFPELCSDGETLAVRGSHKGILKPDWNCICKKFFQNEQLATANWPSLSRLVSTCI